MLDLEDRLRAHFDGLRRAVILPPGDPADLPARGARYHRARRRRAIAAGAAALVVLAGAASFVATENNRGPVEQVSTVDAAPDGVRAGLTFQRVGSVPGLASGHLAAVHGAGEGFVAIGVADDGLPALWRSDDRAGWSRERIDGVGAGDMFGGYAEGDGWRIVWGDDTGDARIGGRERRATAWVSRDGGRWSTARLPGGDGPDSGPSVAFFTPGGPVLLGYRTDLDAPTDDLGGGQQAWPQVVVWTTGDGTAWAPNDLDLGRFGDGEHFGRLIGFERGVVLETLAPPHGRARYWLSTDGRTWNEIDRSALGEDARLDEVAALPGGLVAAGTRSGQAALWHSAGGGRRWEPLDIPGPATGAVLRAVAASRTSDLAVVVDAVSEHVHSDPAAAERGELLTQHHDSGLLLGAAGDPLEYHDLTTALGLDPHAVVAGVRLSGRRVLLAVTRLPAAMTDEASTELWLGTVTRTRSPAG